MGGFPMIRRQKRLQSQAAAYRVHRPPVQLPVPLEDAADFPHRIRQRIKDIKNVAASIAQIDLVRRNESPQRIGIAFYKFHRLPVKLWLIVQLEINSFQLRTSQFEVLGPKREYFVDGRLARGDSNEI